jgi:hypothetical protein
VNCVEGTRQNDSVTSEEGVTLAGQPIKVFKKSGMTTVYVRPLIVCSQVKLREFTYRKL